jgi:transposase-like protein
MGNAHSGSWPAVCIELTAEERMTLEFLSRQRTATYQEVIRARALLKAAEGQRNRCIAHAVGVDERTVRTWRKDFVARRLDSLHDRKRPGRPRRFSPSVRAAVTHLACQKPGTVVSVPAELLASEEPASAAPPPAQDPTPQMVPALDPAMESALPQALPWSASDPETETTSISEADGPSVLFPPDV